MKARYRDLTEKYKTCRLQPEALFLSRLFQTFFNKFTKKGKKALARRHLYTALSTLRLTVRRPRMYNALMRLLRNLYPPLIAVTRRRGKVLEVLPVPVRRNKRETLCLQSLCSAVSRRRERTFEERLEQELLALTFNKNSSATAHQVTELNRLLYNMRTNAELRWR